MSSTSGLAQRLGRVWKGRGGFSLLGRFCTTHQPAVMLGIVLLGTQLRLCSTAGGRPSYHRLQGKEPSNEQFFGSQQEKDLIGVLFPCLLS